MPDLTEASIKAINAAVELATEHGHASCEAAHLAASIFSDVPGNVGPRVCAKAGVDPEVVRKALRGLLLKRPKQTPAPTQSSPDASFKRTLDAAAKAMKNAGDTLVAQDSLLVSV